MTIKSGQFKYYTAGKDKVSARDLNVRGKTLSKVARSLSIDGIASNTGIITRRRGVKGVIKYARIVETLCRLDESSASPADEVNYYKIELLNTPGVYYNAWVFGYSGDLIETVPWFQPGDIVEVIKYNDSRWPSREWWILETVIRVQSSSSGEINCSIAWNATDDRAMGVF